MWNVKYYLSDEGETRLPSWAVWSTQIPRQLPVKFALSTAGGSHSSWKAASTWDFQNVGSLIEAMEASQKWRCRAMEDVLFLVGPTEVLLFLDGNDWRVQLLGTKAHMILPRLWWYKVYFFYESFVGCVSTCINTSTDLEGMLTSIFAHSFMLSILLKILSVHNLHQSVYPSNTDISQNDCSDVW